MKITLHHNDLPSDVKIGKEIAIDTETMGLRPHCDRLCLVQIADEHQNVHLIKFNKSYQAPHLVSILNDSSIQKIFHFARFDMAFLMHYLPGCAPQNIFCTKIASYMCRTYTDKHGLKNITKELLKIEMEKKEQTSYWGAEDLSAHQKQYAANDVAYLKDIKDILLKRLIIEERYELAKTCFDFVITRSKLDLLFGEHFDVFAHHTTR